MSASLLPSKIGTVAGLLAALALSASVAVFSADRAAGCGGGGGAGLFSSADIEGRLGIPGGETV